MDKALKLIRAFAKPSAVVLNFCPTQGGREIGDTEAAVPAAQSGPRSNPHPQPDHLRAAEGPDGQEFEPNGKAAEEIKQVYDYTCMTRFTQSTEAKHVRRRIA